MAGPKAGTGTVNKLTFVLSKLLTHFVILAAAALVLSSIGAMDDAKVVVHRCDNDVSNQFELCFPHPIVADTATKVRAGA